MFDLAAIQAALQEFQLDGWLLYDFRGSNVLAHRVLQMPADSFGSRRYAYCIPAQGTPQKLVHRIEEGALDHLPGDKTVYLRWQEFEAGLAGLVDGQTQVALEYAPRNSNPYISRVDAGTVELLRSFGVTPMSSGDLVQKFEATLSPRQQELHFQAAVHTNAAFTLAWKLIRDRVTGGGSIDEVEVQSAIMQHFADNSLTTYHPPIVGVNGNGGLPHYETGTGSDTKISADDFVLIDLWAKVDDPDGIYSDLTRTGFVGATVPERYTEVFNVVAAGRDAAIDCVRSAFAAKRPLQGWEVDDATRNVIDAAGFGNEFRHRTGHNIGREVHGNGAHMDNLETREERLVMPNTLFSVEPGIYLPEFGIRSEINVLIDNEEQVIVTGGIDGGPPQTEVIPILA